MIPKILQLDNGPCYDSNILVLKNNKHTHPYMPHVLNWLKNQKFGTAPVIVACREPNNILDYSVLTIFSLVCYTKVKKFS